MNKGTHSDAARTQIMVSNGVARGSCSHSDEPRRPVRRGSCATAASGRPRDAFHTSANCARSPLATRHSPLDALGSRANYEYNVYRAQGARSRTLVAPTVHTLRELAKKRKTLLLTRTLGRVCLRFGELFTSLPLPPHKFHFVRLTKELI